MFWSIFIQCVAVIGVTVVIGGVVGMITNRASKD